ncbi:translocase of chloroplast 120, chloroplastic-like [Prosopis cineraria]|uniref:translocase of chloroplast 120, chloroplastic-like n=1 Tax=Prosopis cineraria TaxID=364024 RepID=UPI0024108FBA|nr:translocase of chloroplast 120, chloroplastic-like [Prosopis cineraria]
MDYGAEPSNGYHEIERKSVEDEASPDASIGPAELKDLKTEEMSEEATEGLEHSHDRGVNNCPKDNIVGDDDPSDAVSAPVSSLLHENPDAPQEAENFEEAVSVSCESSDHMEGAAEVIVNQRVDEHGEGLDGIHLDGIDSGETVDGVLHEESYSIGKDQLEGRDGHAGKEVSELNGDVVVRENACISSINPGLVTEKTENEEFLTPRANVGLVLEDESGDRVDNVVSESHTESEPGEKILDEGAGSKAENLEESIEDSVFCHGKTEEQLNASRNPHHEIEDNRGEEVHGNSAHMDAEHQVETTGDVNYEVHGTDIIHENNDSERLCISGGNSTECEDYCNFVTKDTTAGSDLEHQKAISELGEAPPNLLESVGERDMNLDAGSSCLKNSSPDEKSVQATAAELIEGTDKGCLLQKDEGEFGGGGCDTSPVVEEPEKLQEKNIKEKHVPQITQEQNVQHAGEPVSSTGKPAVTNPSPVHPAGLGRAAPLLEPVPRVVQQPRVNGSMSGIQSQQIEDSSNAEAEENDETREKLQMIRVKFLRLAHRLGQTPHNVVVAQVLYRLGLAEQLRGRNGGRVGAFSFDRASAMAEQLEAAGQEPLDFSCTIMVLGKTGVGKSATINSIFDEVKFNTDAFHMGTKKVQDIVGTVQGIKVRVIDTPGLLPPLSDQRHNERILHSVKRFIKKTPPDIVLYLDRLDMQSRDFSDMPLLRTITEIFGPSIWFNAIVVLTHAASAPPDGPNGTASSYDTFVTQRSLVVQQAIRQAAGDMRLMNPVSLVENHSACRTNRAGQRVLPNGQVWKPHLLLLSFASKILAEANALLKLQDSPPGKAYTARARAPPLPFLLSSLLQSRPQLKTPEEQFGDEDSIDDELDESSDSDDETELNDLPPFKPLTKAQLEKLSKAQKKAYFDELEYREKLFMKKQLKEEKKQRKMMKKMAESAKDLPSDYSENAEEESGSAASVPVPMPDLALPASFDSDNPTHRYRYLDSSNQWLVRPVLETHGWDHDVGYEGINVERLFVLRDKVPLSFSGQISKDKKDANVQMEIASSIKHGEGKATSLGFDMQTVGKDLAYTLLSETRFSNFRRNKATAGLSFTFLGDSFSGGVKVEDKLVANKRFKVVLTGGAMTSRGDVAYGGSLEAQLRDKDYPLGRSLSTLGLSIMDWHGDLAVGCNVQSQIPVGRHTNVIARANLNNRGAGQISIRLNSSEQLQIALIGLAPLLKKLAGCAQQKQFGQ